MISRTFFDEERQQTHGSIVIVDQAARQAALLSRELPVSYVLPISQLADMPEHGLLALTSRQVLRAIDTLPEELRIRAYNGLVCLQDTSRRGWGDPLLDLSHLLTELGGDASEENKISSSNEPVGLALYNLGRAVRCVWAESYDDAIRYARAAVVYSDAAARLQGRTIGPDIERDAQAAFRYCERQTDIKKFNRMYSRSSRRRTPFSQSVFASHLAFDLHQPIGGSTILELRSAITEELISRLRAQPTLLYKLHPNDFEILIATVFERFGFAVEVTSPTRDLGRDVIAVSHSPTSIRYLIECKRYSQENKVGIAIVQRLHGVLHGDGGTLGIVATTSSFTAPALEYLSRPNVRIELEGRDFEAIYSWLSLTDKIQLARRALGSARFSLSVDGGVIPLKRRNSFRGRME